ncbi:MAG: hypothetical protein V2A73_10720, partial [Pseudomonadota bacterium]
MSGRPGEILDERRFGYWDSESTIPAGSMRLTERLCSFPPLQNRPQATGDRQQATGNVGGGTV